MFLSSGGESRSHPNAAEIEKVPATGKYAAYTERLDGSSAFTLVLCPLSVLGGCTWLQEEWLSWAMR